MKIIIESWNEGFQKIALTHLQIDLLKLSLKEAKSNVDKLLDGHSIIIDINNEQLATTFVKEVKNINVNCRMLL
ncbi:hypothetical protein [Empedobacter falsenii]|uniref:Uncharacterized protein n=1 Tax=Empedobacter falsenii TaxID=343874 RepID=A0AAW7DE27_9FLAO|nr:hypothetical protein [Empedobacter falsenii]MDM1546432.1 hypothetical protein [Empedobacter falsenii]MDM1550133.1 hypothetical protein [Empedobacter falsenii]